MVALSVVVPCYNEDECLDETHRRLTQAVRSLALPSYEIVYVNDGSTDQTLSLLVSISQNDSNAIVVDLARNHGHQLALTAGLYFAQGARVFIIDADLQDPPELLPEFMAALNAGADVAYGRRIAREHESAFKKISAKLFYRFLSRVANVAIPLDSGDFRLVNRQVLNAFLSMPEAHRFVRGMISWVGFKQVPVDYIRKPRLAGKTKYPFRKMCNLAFDAITGFTIAPLRYVYWAALLAVILAIVMIGWSIAMYFFYETVPGWPSLMTVFLFFTAIQLLSTAFIGEYVGRIFEQSKQRPLFVIRQVIRSDVSINQPE